MTPGEDDKLPAAVIETAAAWFMRLKDEALDAEERARLKAELDAWLAEDEAHRRAWELAQRAWTVAGALPARNKADKAATTPARKQGRKATAPLPDPARPLKTPRPAKAQNPGQMDKMGHNAEICHRGDRRRDVPALQIRAPILTLATRRLSNRHGPDPKPCPSMTGQKL